MGSFNLSYTLVCFLALAMLHTINAQNSQQDYLNAHNSARALVGVGNIVWNTTVAAYAQTYANQRIGYCNLVNSGGPYGENIATGGSTVTGTAAVNNIWGAEKPYYDYATNTCASGHACGHYTQVVWADSTQLGCFRVQCTNSNWFVICSYYPAGNIIGQSPY